MTGTTAGEKASIRQALPGTLAFVGGLTVVFVSLGATASVVSGLITSNKRAIEVVSGLFILTLGLFMLTGRIPFSERRFHPRPGGTPWRTFLLGAAFAFGWTPCIGPTLGFALNLAATADGLNRGVILLFFYSLGIGLPFVLAGLGLVRAGPRLKRRSELIQRIGGGILAFVGVLVLTGRLTQITIWMQRVFTDLGVDLWNV